jgi:hypothetical protein
MAGTLTIHTLFGPQEARTRGNDNIYTPEDVAIQVIEHFKPSGKILEPAAGAGAFLKHLPEGTDWCEIEKGRNFFDYKEKVDWIVTNPPFSLLQKFLEHSYKISTNIVFLFNLPGLFTVKRMKDMHQHKFAIREILLMRQPTTFVQCGRQVAAVWIQKHYKGSIKLTYHEDLIKSYTQKVKWQKQAKRNVKRK